MVMRAYPLIARCIILWRSLWLVYLPSTADCVVSC
jgi:hypothetical protein